MLAAPVAIPALSTRHTTTSPPRTARSDPVAGPHIHGKNSEMASFTSYSTQATFAAWLDWERVELRAVGLASARIAIQYRSLDGRPGSSLLDNPSDPKHSIDKPPSQHCTGVTWSGGGQNRVVVERRGTTVRGQR